MVLSAAIGGVMSMDQIDFERLRSDLRDYYGTAMFSGFPMAVMDLSKVERASDEDLLRIADKEGYNLTKYIKQEWEY